MQGRVEDGGFGVFAGLEEARVVEGDGAWVAGVGGGGCGGGCGCGCGRRCGFLEDAFEGRFELGGGHPLGRVGAAEVALAGENVVEVTIVPRGLWQIRRPSLKRSCV